MTPVEECDRRRAHRTIDRAQFIPTETGIWCPACKGQVVPASDMHDPDIELPEECGECGYPDEMKMREKGGG